MITRKIRSLPWLVLILLGAWAFAQSAVQLELVAYKVITVPNEEGQPVEKLVRAVETAPGDLLEWRLRAQNTAEQPLHNVVLVIPIPPQTVYQEGSAAVWVSERGDRRVQVLPEFSYDGGQTYGTPPLFKEVKVKENGQEVVKKVQVKPEEYTHARWVLPVMQPGEAVEVFLRTVVR